MDPSWIMFVLSFVVAMTTLCELTIGTHLMVATLPYALYKGLANRDHDLTLASSIFLALMLINWLAIVMLVLSCASGYIEKYVNYDVINLISSLSIVAIMVFVNQKAPASRLSNGPSLQSQHQFRISGFRPQAMANNESQLRAGASPDDWEPSDRSGAGSSADQALLVDAFENNILQFQYREFMRRKNTLLSCNSIDGCSELLYMHKFRRCCGWQSPRDWLQVESQWKYERDITIMMEQHYQNQPAGYYLRNSIDYQATAPAHISIGPVIMSGGHQQTPVHVPGSVVAAGAMAPDLNASSKASTARAASVPTETVFDESTTATDDGRRQHGASQAQGGEDYYDGGQARLGHSIKLEPPPNKHHVDPVVTFATSSESNEQFFNESERLPEFCCAGGSAATINNGNRCYLSSPFLHTRGCRETIISDRAHTNPISYGTGYMYIMAKLLASLLHFVCRYYKLFEEGEGIFSHTMPR